MADKDNWDWKEWCRTLVVVWGAAAILGFSNGLSHPPPTTQPVSVVQVASPQARADVNSRFFKLADSLETVSQRLTKSSADVAAVTEVRSLAKRLDKLPDIHPCEETVKKRIDSLVKDLEMLDVQLKKTDDPKREEIERTANAVSEVVAVLKSICE
jgi:predicted RNA-binding protein with EMAP domain